MDPLERALVEGLWFPVARGQDVGPDAPVAGRLLDRALVAFRGPAGVTVAEDRCPHRGAALSAGSVEVGELRCPYHGWRFRAGDGRCTWVPSLPDGTPPRAALAVYRVAERYGWVWACLGEPLRDLPTLPPLRGDTFVLRYGEPHDLHCGYRQLTENFRDMSHFPFVHRKSMGPNVRPVVERYRVERNADVLSWVLPTDLGGTAFGGNPALAAEQTLSYTLVLPSFSTVETAFPDGGHRLVVQLAVPIDAAGEWCRQFYAVGLDPVASRHPEASLDEVFEYERRIFQEDWPIVESQTPREAPLDVESQAHTRADAFSLAFREAYRALVFEAALASDRAAGDS
jgi:phenylpropionate dioxygenase-like ring-hydroxylating dioxygenase large terminal subunit